MSMYAFSYRRRALKYRIRFLCVTCAVCCSRDEKSSSAASNWVTENAHNSATRERSREKLNVVTRHHHHRGEVNGGRLDGMSKSNVGCIVGIMAASSSSSVACTRRVWLNWKLFSRNYRLFSDFKVELSPRPNWNVWWHRKKSWAEPH